MATARERALAMRACVAKRLEEVAALERRLREDARSFTVEQARVRADNAASEAQIEQQMARARSEAERFRERHRRRKVQLEEEVVAASREASDNLRRTSAGGELAAEPPPEALRARVVAEAAGDSAGAALAAGLPGFYAAAHAGARAGAPLPWPRLVAQLGQALAKALDAPRPSAVQMPSWLRPPVAGGPSALDAAALAMANQLLDLAATAQAGAASAGRRAELERALSQERARADITAEEAEAAWAAQQKLLGDLIAARQRRRAMEAEQADFVPFAAQELAGAIERVARIRQAPATVRRLAAAAGHRLRNRRRAQSAEALRASPSTGGRSSRPTCGSCGAGSSCWCASLRSPTRFSSSPNCRCGGTCSCPGTCGRVPRR